MSSFCRLYTQEDILSHSHGVYMDGSSEGILSGVNFVVRDDMLGAVIGQDP